APEILAYLRSQNPEVELEQQVPEWNVAVTLDLDWQAVGKSASFVKDVVGGQLLLGYQANDFSTGDQSRAVEAQALEEDHHSDRKDGGHLGGCLSEVMHFLPLMLDEALPLDQILGRIAADQLLLENSDRGLLLRHLMRKLERSIHVVGQRAHGGVDVGESYFD